MSHATFHSPESGGACAQEEKLRWELQCALQNGDTLQNLLLLNHGGRRCWYGECLLCSKLTEGFKDTTWQASSNTMSHCRALGPAGNNRNRSSTTTDVLTGYLAGTESMFPASKGELGTVASDLAADNAYLLGIYC